jgi:hypothetical protein
MRAKKKPEPEVIEMPGRREGKLKAIGGSMSDEWNSNLANETIRTLWYFEDSDPEVVKKQQLAAINALTGIAPRDECEGMIAAQLVACHHASMECYRGAMFHGHRTPTSSSSRATTALSPNFFPCAAGFRVRTARTRARL